eukprot:309439_1
MQSGAKSGAKSGVGIWGFNLFKHGLKYFKTDDNTQYTCAECGKSHMNVTPQCPGKKHGLKYFKTPNKNFKCDGCKKSMKKNDELFGCRKCDYYLCCSCYKDKEALPISMWGCILCNYNLCTMCYKDKEFTAISIFWKAAVIAEQENDIKEKKKRVIAIFDEAKELFASNKQRIELWASLYSTSCVISSSQSTQTNLEELFAAEARFWDIIIAKCDECKQKINEYRNFTLVQENISVFIYSHDDFDPHFIQITNYYIQCGLLAVFNVEKALVPGQRWSAIWVALIGVVQVAVGVCLIYTGVGSTVGAFLVKSGLSDMYAGIVGAIKGEFNLKQYLIGKVIEIGIALITAGVGGSAPVSVGDICKEFAINVATTKAPQLLRSAGLDGFADVLEIATAISDMRNIYKNGGNKGKFAKFQKCMQGAGVGLNALQNQSYIGDDIKQGLRTATKVVNTVNTMASVAAKSRTK